jgi:hypothetical protein
MLPIYAKKVENYKFYQLQHQFCFSATLGFFENLLLLQAILANAKKKIEKSSSWNYLKFILLI